ncbi:MAG: nucleotide disphospho-sugar-binding domain-containing protein [Sciscionella sp.]
MRILFIAGGSTATIFALSPLAMSARNAGHEVFMASTEDMMPVVAASGLPAVPVTNLTIKHFITTDRSGNPVEFPANPVGEMFFTGRWFGRMAAASLDALLALAGNWHPDLVVGGTMSYAAPILAAHLGVPFVRHAWDISDPTIMDQGANEELRPELAQAGLDELPEPDMWIDICPPSLRRQDAPVAQMMRWIPGNRQRQLEPWMYTRPERGRVCVTSGTRVSHERNFEFLCNLAETVSALDAEVVIAAQEDIAADLREELGDVRAGWLPLDVVAPTCDLIVHHAGGVTALTAMNAGVPQLLFPSDDAKAVVPSQRIADFGAAITLLRGEDSPDGIRKACQELLSNPSYGARARALADEITTLPTSAEVVGVLERAHRPQPSGRPQPSDRPRNEHTIEEKP